MKLPLIIAVFLLSISCAHADDSVTLCPDPHIPDCVVSNWGLVEPDGVDSAIAPSTPLAAATAQGGRSAVRVMTMVTPVAAMARAATPPLKTVVSPNGLFARETAALTAAIRKARFNRDGAIVRGEREIAAAAAEATRKAGAKYVLTIYVKVSQQLKPDASALLGKKVATVNGVLAGRSYDGQTDKPKS